MQMAALKYSAVPSKLCMRINRGRFREVLENL